MDWNHNKDAIWYRSIGRTLHECVDWNCSPQITPSKRYMSHSTRVRGLKSGGNTGNIGDRLVALYTSAWIEITVVMSSCWKLIGRTLHECVDWNQFDNQHFAAIPLCRTLHECVDWNDKSTNLTVRLTRRTLHECVDWNKLNGSI